jgi:hypothetical protein
MGVVTEFRLDGGTNQAAAKRCVPEKGPIRRVVNMRIRRENELEVRPGYTAVDMGIYDSGTLFAHQLCNYGERLMALGAGASGVRTTRFCEYVGLAEGWREVSSATTFPYVTDVRDIGLPPDQSGGVASATAGAYDGIVMLAYDTGDSDGFVHIFRAEDDATLVFQRLTAGVGDHAERPVAFATNDGNLIVVGVDAAGSELGARAFDPATDEDLPSTADALQSVDSKAFAAAPVTFGGSGYVTIGLLSGDMVVRHYNDSHVQQMTRTISGVTGSGLSIAANGTQDRITIAYVDGSSSQVAVRTLVLSTGADSVGPTTLIAPTTLGMVSVKYQQSDSLFFQVAADITSTSPRKIVHLAVSGAHAITVTREVEDAQLSADVLGVESMAAYLHGATNQTVNALCDVAGRLPLAFKDFGIASASLFRLGTMVQDAETDRVYWVNFRTNNDGEPSPSVTELRIDRQGGRQFAELGGLLHISGGLPLVCDGRQAVEMGFGEAPVLSSVASTSAGGSVTAEADYQIQVHPEWVDARRNVHRGPPSLVESHTTSAGDNRVTFSSSGLHSLRRTPAAEAEGSSYRLVAHRTAAITGGETGENLFRETFQGVPLGTDLGELLAFTLTDSDAALRAKLKTIYTQAQTPVPDHAPPPCRFMWSTGQRLVLGGLPLDENVLHSKLLFPFEAVAFSTAEDVRFSNRADSRVHGVASSGKTTLVLTGNGIYAIGGEGPDHAGLGEFESIDRISRTGSRSTGAQALVEVTDLGLFYQRSDDQICLLTPQGQTLGIGEGVQDELDSYPVITASCYLRQQHAVAFAVTNEAGDEGVILVYDIDAEAWSVDDVSSAPLGLAEYQGRLAYIDEANAVFVADEAVGTGAMPTQIIETYYFDFDHALGWGEVLKCGTVAEWQGDCTATLAYAAGQVDDATFNTIGTWALTAANGYSAGKSVDIIKAPPNRDTSRFALRLTITGGSGTPGIRVNKFVVETAAVEGLARRPARDTQ